MSLIMITESMKLMEAKNVTLGAKEKEFVLPVFEEKEQGENNETEF